MIRRPLPDHYGYLVGDNGTFWSRWKKNSGPVRILLPKYRLVKPHLHLGYPRVCLAGRIHRKLHQLVLEVFRGPCPENMEARHLDGNKTNCNLSNLVWGTRFENMMDRTRLNEHGDKSRPGEIHGMAKLTNSDVLRIRALRSTMTYKQLAEKFRISKSQIKVIVTRRAWTHI